MNKHAAPPLRKATNISLDTRLLQEARALGINVSRACERGLAAQIAETRAEQWRVENAEAVASSNSHVERNGLPLSAFRQF